ncbi:hypothetical protein Nepgr_020116 [Nepenthes gracilis]|uniref:Uncharacterized protein n=1 Tax=Nepenthes gracilis TaxID=150966 RepID=A0AAD3SUU5_NEPGR|nr:hypothetical protein Nepgr_020116 [Nepenthes gracilis]
MAINGNEGENSISPDVNFISLNDQELPGEDPEEIKNPMLVEKVLKTVCEEIQFSESVVDFYSKNGSTLLFDKNDSTFNNLVKNSGCYASFKTQLMHKIVELGKNCEDNI